MLNLFIFNTVLVAFNLTMYLLTGNWMSLCAMVVSVFAVMQTAIDMFDYETGYYGSYDTAAY